MPVAGWYADPWHQAALRWWDGVQWTGAVSAPAAAPAAVQTPAGRGLAALFGDADRIAVIDVETTGLYTKDRVVEIAIVTLDANGVVIDEFDTLINPARDVGPTWIHRITPSMVHSAPLFSDVAGHVAARVHGAVCVGHNLRFDSRMIGAEMQRAGIDVDWGSGLDTLSVTGCKLAQACADHGVALDDAHRALADARATAHLLVAVAEQFGRSGAAARAYPVEASPIRVCTRDGHSNADAPAPYLAQLAAGGQGLGDREGLWPARRGRHLNAVRESGSSEALWHPRRIARRLPAVDSHVGPAARDQARAHRRRNRMRQLRPFMDRQAPQP